MLRHLRVEGLEDRTLLSADFAFDAGSGDFSIDFADDGIGADQAELKVDSLDSSQFLVEGNDGSLLGSGAIADLQNIFVGTDTDGYGRFTWEHDFSAAAMNEVSLGDTTQSLASVEFDSSLTFSASQDISIMAVGNVTIAGNNATDASVSVIAGDNVTIEGDWNAGQQINVTGDQIDIAGNLTAGDTVSLDALTGAIVQNGVSTITAANLVMRAGTGIGDAATSDGGIDVEVDNLAAQTVSGDIHIEDLNGELTVGTLNLHSGDTVTGISITSGGAGDEIFLRKRDGAVANDNLVIDAPVINAGAGNITLVADGDDTTDDLDFTADVTANGGNILIVSYEDIESALPGVVISTTGQGDISLHAGATFTFGSPVDTAGGDADGDIFLGSPNHATVQTDDGDILLTATDNILLGVLNADADNNRTGASADPGNGNVTVIADADSSGVGDIRDSFSGEAPTDLNIIGNAITLSAATGIGSDSAGAELGDTFDLDIDGVTLTATNSVSGAVQIFAVGDIALDAITNADGSLSDPDGTVIIDATGQITDADPTDDSAANITSERIILRAVTGLGDASTDLGDIDIDAQQLAAQTGTGDIHIQETSDSAANAGLELTALNAQTGFSNAIEIVAGGSGDEILIREGATTAADLLVILAPIVNNGPGNITLFADGDDAADDLDLQADVTANGGDILIVSFEDIESEVPGVVLSTTGQGNISLHAGATFTFNSPVNTSGGDADGDIFLGSPNHATVQTDDGDILLTATDNILLGVLNADTDNNRTGASADPGNGNVTVIADADNSDVGDIRDALNGEAPTDLNIIGNAITLSAATGIGSDPAGAELGDTSDLDIDGVTLTATNSVSGAVQIFAVGDIALGVVTNADGSLSDPDGIVIIDATGKITDADSTDDSVPNITSEQVILRAVTGIGDVSTALGDIDIDAKQLTAQTDTGDVHIQVVRDTRVMSDIVGRVPANGQWWLARSTGTNFINEPWARWSADAGWRDVMLADVNGDGLRDILGRTDTGDWWVTRSSGASFIHEKWGGWTESAGWSDVSVADVNGDGLDDIVGRANNGSWWVALSTGAGFSNEKWGGWTESAGWTDVQVGDVNGDGRDDIVGRANNGAWWVARSSGTGFINEKWGGWTESAGWTDVQVADVNGDGLGDIVGRANNGAWWVARSSGTHFVNEKWGGWSDGVVWTDVLVADVNGDGRDDIVGRTSGNWWVAKSTGSQFVNERWGMWTDSITWDDVGVGDFNGDGRYDIAGRANGNWWVAKSEGTGFTNEKWGEWSSAVDWQDVLVGNVSNNTAVAQALHAAELPKDETAATDLTDALLAPLVDEAILRLAAAGALHEELTELATVSFRIADLSGALLGQISGDKVLIDRNAAGFGWYVDATPQDDTEFQLGSDSHERLARPGTSAEERMDLLTAVMHELGHVLGHEHADESSVMQESLAPGVRRLGLGG